jgi:uncharacterized protein YndB with AHSA1/START domain
MSGDADRSGTSPPDAVVVRQLIPATAERLFQAWTHGEELRQWWGPGALICTGAEVDPRVGGQYRIDHQRPDGTTVTISGEFEHIERPRRLVYTWRIGPPSATSERVTVTFEPVAQATEVIVVHERIADAATRERHARGWHDCLGKLAGYVARQA